MKVAMYHGPGDVRIEEAEARAPMEGEIALEVATAGICGSDVGEYVGAPLFVPLADRHAHSGHLGPTILGHEFSGRVTEVGSRVEGFAAGDLVAVGAGVSCGQCGPCRQGSTNRCTSYWTVGLHAHGGLAEQATVPASCALNVTRSALTADLAALCQPMSIAVHATRRARVTDEDTVLVLGTGGIGTFITYAAAHAGAHVTSVDLENRKLEAASRLGATTTIDASRDDLDEEIGRREPPTVVFECTAKPDSLRRAVSAVAEGGRVVVVGHQSRPVELDFKLVSMGERELIGTMAHVYAADLPTAAKLIAEDPEAWSAVAPTVYPLSEVTTSGLRPMSQGEPTQIKILFDPAITTPRPLSTS